MSTEMADSEDPQISSKIAVLTQIYGDNINKKYELCGSEMKIGRQPSSQIKLDNPSVSRTHCILSHSSEGWFVKDNGSQNGTFVNGIPIPKGSSCHLRFGDIIFLGPPSALPTAFAFDDTHEPTRFVYTPKASSSSKVSLISRKNKEDAPQTKHSETDRKLTEKNKNSLIKTNLISKKNKVDASQTKHSQSERKVTLIKIHTADGSRSNGVLDDSVIELPSTSVATNSLHTNENQERATKAVKSCTNIYLDASVTPERISPILNVAKKTKIDFNQDSQDELSSSATQDEDSQSLLDIGSCDLLDYPFSQQLDSSDIISDNKSDSLKNIVCNKAIKKENSLKAVENDNEHLKSALANLSEEIKRLEKSKSDLLKEYEEMRQKNERLDQQLAEQQKIKEDLKTCEMRVKNNFKSEIMEKLEEDLVCHICTELLIKPVVLDCSHTFCEHCIAEWKKKKKQCPICRNCIQSQTRVLALDHFIDRTLETLTPDQKEKRKEVIAERERIKFETSQLRRQKRGSRGRRGRRSGRYAPAAPINIPSDLQIIEIIRPGTSAGNDESSASFIISDEILREELYGIGPCYNCGQYGHYHYDCPL